MRLAFFSCEDLSDGSRFQCEFAVPEETVIITLRDVRSGLVPQYFIALDDLLENEMANYTVDGPILEIDDYDRNRLETISSKFREMSDKINDALAGEPWE